MLGRAIATLARMPRTGHQRRRAPTLQPLAAALAVTSALILALPASAQYGPVDPADSTLRALREGIASNNDGVQHAAMVALRQLRDPSLRPFLERMTRSDDWSLRVDAVLGLAELDPAKRIDLALVEALPGESDRESALSAAITLEMLDVPRIETLLGWDDLPPLARALLMGEMRRLGGRPDEALLEKLAQSKSPEVAGIAAAILADLGAPGAKAACENAAATLAALPPKARSTAIAQIVEVASVDRLANAAPFAASLAMLPDIAPDARMRILGSLLVLSPEHAYPLFAAAVERERTQLALMRHAAVLLASGARAPAAEWARVRNGDPLLEGIADAGVLLAQGDDLAAYRKLASLKHRITLVAALEGARRLGPSAEQALGIELLELLRADPRELGPMLDPVLRGLARLATIAPGEMRTALEASLADGEGSREIQEAILLTLHGASSAEATEVASIARGRATRLGEALVCLARAQMNQELAAEDIDMLATVAGGGTGVDPGLRTQAAWHWTRYAKRTEAVIDALCEASLPSPTPSASPSSESSAPASAPSKERRP